ncbi:MAG: EamA family transporter [Mailhella sp.]|nr:EamA family transporter [Mailhella sp.]
MKKTLIGIAFVLLAAAMWGTLPTFSRLAYAEGSDPYTAAAMRAYLASLVFLVWLGTNGTLRRLQVREIGFYFIYGLAGVSGTFLFYMIAVEKLSTAMAAMLLYTGPSFVIVFSRIFYKERITRAKLAALVCTAIGCALVLRLYAPGGGADPLGVFIGLCSGLSYSMVTVLGKKAAGYRHDSITNAGLMIVFGTLVFFFIRPPWKITVPTISLGIDYLGLALFGSVFAYIAYLKGLGSGLEGGIASITASIEPVMATVISAAVFGDVLEWQQALGMGIVLFGVSIPILAQRIRR